VTRHPNPQLARQAADARSDAKWWRERAAQLDADGRPTEARHARQHAAARDAEANDLEKRASSG
jgi:hypothetical protein